MEQKLKEFLKDKKPLENLTLEEKEDLGLLFLMKQADRSDIASEEEVLRILG